MATTPTSSQSTTTELVQPQSPLSTFLSDLLEDRTKSTSKQQNIVHIVDNPSSHGLAPDNMSVSSSSSHSRSRWEAIDYSQSIRSNNTSSTGNDIDIPSRLPNVRRASSWPISDAPMVPVRFMSPGPQPIRKLTTDKKKGNSQQVESTNSVVPTSVSPKRQIPRIPLDLFVLREPSS